MRFKRSVGSNDGSDDDFSLSMTPLVDVVFLLLIFFMVSTAFIDFTKKLDIELPESKANASIKQVKEVVIEIDTKKRIYLNGKRVSLAGLETKLKSLRKGGAKKTVMIRADKTLPYGEVITVMGICKEAHFNTIGVAVK